MKPNAIVYTSGTGYTAEYAAMLGAEIGLPVYSLKQSKDRLRQGESIIYLGWIMAGQIMGYKNVSQRYAMGAVCCVGMGIDDSKIKDIKQINSVSENTSIFTLTGGYNYNKLKGVYKIFMKVMSKFLIKSVEKKSNRTPAEETMLDLLLHGGSYVNKDNLNSIIDWYNLNKST